MDYVSKQVSSIVFSMLSPKDIKKIACAKIVTPELYDKEGYPVDGGLMDIRLGVIDPGLRCKTCGEKLKECTGHFGYIDLARPVMHVAHMKTVLDILRTICRDCSRILLEDKDAENFREDIERLRKEENAEAIRKKVKSIIETIRKNKKCPHCKKKQYNFKLERPTTIYENEKKLSPIEMLQRFEKIPDEDIQVIGMVPKFSRPEWTILTVLQIPPVTMRPSITLESGERSEDDLTHKLGDIVRINQRLFENINAGAPEIIVEDLWDLLQYHMTTYFDNTLTQIPPARHRSGQPLKTLVERIKSKEGRFRHNLTGKRVNYAARTVISPDTKIRLNEVGVPQSIVKELTVPERVTEWNLKWLKELVKKGPAVYPGANYVILPDGRKRKITEDTVEQLLEELAPGYAVERHVVNGDIAIFNRQPSLHKMSFMCHKIRVLPGNSFRLNPAICVAPDTKVLLSTGIQRKIDELKNCWKESELSTFDWKKNLIKSTELKKFWGLKPEEYGAKCYKLSTEETSRSVIATGDHPFYTDKGVKAAKDIRVGDRVIVRPIDTPEYEDSEKEILSIADIKHNRTYIKHAVRVLAGLKLLPLSLRDQRTMIIARLLGHLFGDGTFILRGHSGRLIFRGKKKDLETIQDDIMSLGFKPEKIYVKTYTGEIQTVKGKKLNIVGRGAYFEVRNKPLALLFKALGAPNGDKAKTNFSVPAWILKSSDYIKREFLAAYFGSELSSPALRQNSSSNFRTLRFKISKIESKVKNGIKFISQIKKMLKEFGISVSLSRESGNLRKDGNKSVSLVVSINSNKSILNLFGRIGYLYSKTKDDKARLAYQYYLLKENEIRRRTSAHKKFFELRKKGYTFNQISKRLKIKVSVLENWVYRHNKAGLLSGFIGFGDWLKTATNGIRDTGLVWETISAKKDAYLPFVYDVTTTAKTHNFFANGFLTKNCHPYNADFDGDEMNLHIPQTEESRAEAEVLMQVQSQIITPKSGYNVIGCMQDAISGNYLLTKEMVMPKDEAVNLLVSIGVRNYKAFENFRKDVTGKEIFSAVLPDDFEFLGFTKAYNSDIKDKETIVEIKKGKLVSGIIDKATIGEGNGTLIRALHHKYGDDITLDLMGKIFKLGIAALLKRGFTTSTSDTDLPEEINRKIQQIHRDSEREVNNIIENFKAGKIEALPGKTEEETLEILVLQVLNKVRNKIGDLIVDSSKDENGIIIMARSGARGNMLNLSMMAACVGQQALRGKRIDNGYSNRTLSLFRKNDLSPLARGFIKDGFKHGLSPVEFFFGAMTGRDSLMDTALRTPKSGYLYRRLANALQDLKVEYDYTVRDANRSVIQFSYGDDNLDVARSEGGIIDVKKIVREVVGGING